MEKSPILQLFPVDEILSVDHVPEVPSFHQPTPVLLSQIRSINRELVEVLEQMGIYDTKDFQQTADEIIANRLLPESDVIHIHNLIEKLLPEERPPQQLLPLPDNYVLIAVMRSTTHNFLSLLWRGLHVKLDTPNIDGWYSIRSLFGSYHDHMSSPEVIGRVMLNNPPPWLEDVSPLSTYLSAIPFDQSLIRTAQKWSYPLSQLTRLDSVDQLLFAQEYLIRLSKKN